MSMSNKISVTRSWSLQGVHLAFVRLQKSTHTSQVPLVRFFPPLCIRAKLCHCLWVFHSLVWNVLLVHFALSMLLANHRRSKSCASWKYFHVSISFSNPNVQDWGCMGLRKACGTIEGFKETMTAQAVRVHIRTRIWNLYLSWRKLQWLHSHTDKNSIKHCRSQNKSTK